ncbi:MAG: ATP-binding protein [Planctomycetes bacterium]|nr:ATP-binding protein [Planctomycetota bacterium]
MLVERAAERIIRERLKSFPAVGLVGPRQSGKTTLARTLSAVCFDLEQEGDRVRLELQWDELTKKEGLVVLDEAQAFPSVFPRVRAAIDADRRRNGRFLLLGSVSPSLMRAVSESLAGRLALVELTPFLLTELDPKRLDDLWLYGGYPNGGILNAQAYGIWQREYLGLLAQRDLPAWGLPARAQTTERLLRMVAAMHGQQWNATQIGQGLGLTHPTVNSHMDYLEGAFLVRCLYPFQANLRKRLTKRPKYYWRDSGLLHALLRVSTFDDLLAQPWVGASWEGFAIEQIVSVLKQRDPMTEAHFFRTSDGCELDLLVEFRKERWAFEIKLTSAPDVEDLRRLNQAADLVKADRRVLMSRVKEVVESGRTLSCSLPDFLSRI